VCYHKNVTSVEIQSAKVISGLLIKSPPAASGGLPPNLQLTLSRSLAARTRTLQIDFLMCARALRWPFCVQRRRALTQRENIGLELRFVLFEPITYSLKSNLALAASAFSARPPLCIDCAE
jgi:hypothetical protein